MMRNPMRRTGTTIAALSAATAWSFNRPGDCNVVRMALGCRAYRQSGPGKPD
jgi:hypothetical protein